MTQQENINVVHINMDTLRRDHLGCYGSSFCQTPNIDRLASQAIIFDRAYCASFPCMPARRDFLTGCYEFPFRGWGPLEEPDLDLPQLLKETDVVTALITDHYHLFREGAGNYHYNFDYWEYIRGIEADHCCTDSDLVYAGENADLSWRELRKSRKSYYHRYRQAYMKEEKDWFAPRTFQAASDWLRKNQGHARWFMQIDEFPPHEPFDPPPGYAEKYLRKEFSGLRKRYVFPRYAPCLENYTQEELEYIRACYAGNIDHVDHWFGIFLDTLEELDLMKNTMIILTSDHGTFNGDHGWTGKLNTYMYDCISHIPTIIYHPGIFPRREKALVQNVDIVPTIIDAFGLSPNVFEFHGYSLLPLMKKNSTSVRKYAHSGFYGRNHIVNDGRYALHLWHRQDLPLNWYGMHDSVFVKAGDLGPFNGTCRPVDTKWDDKNQWSDALFDLAKDSEQKHNIIEKEPEITQRMKQEIRRFLKEIQAPGEMKKRLGL